MKVSTTRETKVIDMAVEEEEKGDTNSDSLFLIDFRTIDAVMLENSR